MTSEGFAVSIEQFFHARERLGEIGTIIHKDVDTMELVVGHLWTRMCADGIVSAVLLPLLFFADMRMALITIAGISFALLFLVRALKTAGKMEAGAGDRLADMVSLFVEYVKGIPLLKDIVKSQINEPSGQILTSYKAVVRGYELMKENKIDEAKNEFKKVPLNSQLQSIVKNLEHYQGNAK